MLRNKVLIGLVCSGLMCGAANATTFVLMDDAALLNSSDVVLTGTVMKVESAESDADKAIHTYVHVETDRVIKGDLTNGPIALRELGGRFGEVEEHIFGAAEYWVGERVLLFLSRTADGTLQTNSMSMGKYSLGVDTSGHQMAVRDFGHGASVLVPETGAIVDPEPERKRFLPMLKRLRRLARETRGRERRLPVVPVPPELVDRPTEVQEGYTFLSPAARWFEPDSGQAVSYLVEAGGDATLGATVSRAAIDAAFAAWTNVNGASIVLTDGGTTTSGAFAGCTFNRVLFNDPSNEIQNPSGCGGILAIGGYCTSGQTTVVNGTTFSRIAIGKVMFNNGWGGCSGWNQCNVSEVATHELGHTIGFGHSADTTATMAAIAHFDGRCASLKPDDVAGAQFVYPQTGPSSTPTNTPSRTSTSTMTPTRTPTFTPTRTYTPTATPTRTSTSTSTSTPTSTPTRTATFTPTATPTRTFTQTQRPTSTPTSPPTQTPTFTSTSVPTSTPTLTPSFTPTFTPTLTATFTPTDLPTPTPQLMVGGQIMYYSNHMPVNGVQVQMPPDPGLNTDSTGTYAYTDLDSQMHELMPTKHGDFGTAVSALDAAFVLQAAVGARTLSDEQKLAGDVTGNGAVSSLDASRILQFKVGLINHFPVADLCNADWAFVPVPSGVPNQQLIQPSVGSGSCEHGAIVYDPLVEPAMGQDFHAILFGDTTGNWQPSGGGGSPLAVGVAPGVRFGRTTFLRNGRMRLPVYVNVTQPVYSLDLRVRLAPADMSVVGVSQADGAGVVAFNMPSAGVLLVAAASPTPLNPNGRVHLVVELQSHRRPGVLRSAELESVTVEGLL